MYSFVEHFKTVVEHKRLVAEGCFAVGLYYQGIVHDLSKFSPDEFLIGARFFQGNRSPNNAEREERGYSSAWLHHKGRNKHHYEYWVDYSSQIKGDVMQPVKMPLKYVVEMFIDRIAAAKIYNGDKYTDDTALRYFVRSMDRIPMHSETKAMLYALLRMLSVYGEEKTFNYIRRRLLKNGSY